MNQVNGGMKLPIGFVNVPYPSTVQHAAKIICHPTIGSNIADINVPLETCMQFDFQPPPLLQRQGHFCETAIIYTIDKMKLVSGGIIPVGQNNMDVHEPISVPVRNVEYSMSVPYSICETKNIVPVHALSRQAIKEIQGGSLAPEVVTGQVDGWYGVVTFGSGILTHHSGRVQEQRNPTFSNIALLWKRIWAVTCSLMSMFTIRMVSAMTTGLRTLSSGQGNNRQVKGQTNSNIAQPVPALYISRGVA